ncbi:MAG: carboxymuconolactone decarboxylase family protein [Acidobacteriota bacterium]|nr:MAG: carboxymuconolactone decarboxylase family protein [Acidobacteriota bacterium]
MSQLPGHYEKFLNQFPGVGDAYKALGGACREAGPLDSKSLALVKIGLAVGAGLEGATHSHVRRALEAGVTNEEIRHAVIQGTTTIGFPRMMAGLAWVEDVLTTKV